MGSLTSRPKVAAVQQPQIIYVPASTTTPSTASSTSQSSSSTTTADTSSTDSSETSVEKTATESRKENLLSRNRSRYGTITTSFRGLLGSAQASGDRKILLGE